MTTAYDCRARAGVETCRPSEMGQPISVRQGALVRSIQRSHQVLLPQGPVRGKFITRHVSCQGSIGYINTSMRACVYDCGKLDLRRLVGSYATDTFNGPITGNVDRCRTSPFGEELVREESAR